MAREFPGPFDPIELSDPEFEHDGLRHLTFYSQALCGRGDVSIFIPREIQFPAEIPLVLLLHGVWGSHWAWFLKGAAHRTAQRLIDRGEIHPMILAAPSDGLTGDGSGYWPMPGRNIEAWIANDVPACVRQNFTSNGPTFLCGLSMGGYGALRLGCKYPDRFHGVSAHSSITAAQQMYDVVRDRDLNLSALPPHETEILHWARLHRDRLPPLRFDCGKGDPLSEASATFHRDLSDLNIPHSYEIFSGRHEWSYWREHIADTLRFFDSLL
jgi:putative tributyrin esterase